MTRTLETLTTELQRKGMTNQREIEQRIHAAAMLSLVEASHAVVNQTTMPTPLYRIQYDTDTHTVAFKTLDGRAPVPQTDALDVNMLDLLLSSLLKQKMPLLLEGKTGVGKTFTVEQFFKTILPGQNYRGLRLNANMSNVLQPYTEGKVVNGLVQISLRYDELDRIAALFVDEVNRGDTNQVLMLQDGVVRLSSGEGGEVGIPIPQYDGTKWTVDRENKRPLFVVSAQNPPATKDAKYSATKRMDAAQVNRNLQIDVPNSASDIGASVLLLENGNGQHGQFMAAYTTKLAEMLRVEPEQLRSLSDDWISLYAFATDPRKTVCPSIQSGIEFMDALLSLVAPDVKESFAHEQQVSKDWNEALRGYGVDFKYDSTLDDTAISMEKLRTIVKSFEEEIITRDTVKVKKLSDALSLLRRIKGSLTQPDPVQAYLATANYVTVQDVACGFAIMLYDKQDKHDVDPVVLIDSALQEYIGITEKFADKIGYKKQFTAEDPNMSVYHLAFQHALHAVSTPDLGSRIRSAVGGGVTNPATTAFVKDLGASVAELKRLDAGNEYRKPLVGRMIADLTTLAGFADQYAAELEPVLANPTNNVERRDAFKKFYLQQREKATTPDIYLHRLTRVLGV